LTIEVLPAIVHSKLGYLVLNEDQDFLSGSGKIKLTNGGFINE